MSARRTFLASAAAIAGTTLVRRPAAGAQFEFRAASTLPVDHPSSVRATQMWEAIAAESGGRIRTKFYPASQLGSDPAMFSQLRSGAINFMIISPGTFGSVVQGAEITNVGFAFADAAQALHACDGPLGASIRAQIAAVGLYAMATIWDSGMREITSSSHPIRTADDMNGFKIRVVESRLVVDLFRTLGANPTPLSFAELYTALQTKIVDGCDLPLNTIESGRIFEVQKYLSLTNHTWSGLWALANGDTWKSLTPDLQAIVERNNTKFALLERRDSTLLGASIADKLQRRGLGVTHPDRATFEAKLGPYYQRCRDVFGAPAWTLLQNAIGRTLG